MDDKRIVELMKMAFLAGFVAAREGEQEGVWIKGEHISIWEEEAAQLFDSFFTQEKGGKKALSLVIGEEFSMQELILTVEILKKYNKG